MGIKDQGLLEYLEDFHRFADLANGTIFQGKQVVHGEYLEIAPRKKRVFFVSGRTPEKVQKKKSSKQVQCLERERDMLTLNNQPGRKFYLACEGQSEADYEMPVRKFTYDGVEYSSQIKDGNGAKERADGASRPLVPVFHLVLYLGEKQWLSKHTLQEMMNIPEDMREFRSLLPDYQIQLVDIHEQNPDYFQTEWKDIVRLMNHSRKKEELKKYVEENREELRNLSMETRRFLAILLEQYDILEDGRIEVKEMCEAWDGAMMMYKEEGEERVNRLNLLLIAHERYEDLKRASKDREYQRQLFESFQI